MAEKLFEISKRQYESLFQLMQLAQKLQEQLMTIANTIMLGFDEVLPKAGVNGVRCVEDKCYLIVEIPDEPIQTG